MGLSSFLKGSTFQWSMPSWSHGLSFLCCSRQARETRRGWAAAAAAAAAAGRERQRRALAAAALAALSQTPWGSAHLALLARRPLGALLASLSGGALLGGLRGRLLVLFRHSCCYLALPIDGHAVN